MASKVDDKASTEGNERVNTSTGDDLKHHEASAQELETVDTYPTDSVHHEHRSEKDLPALQESDDYVHHHMNWRLFRALTAMAFLWVGSQIPLYLFGSVLPLIYQDIGGYERYIWFVIGYLIPNAALCPFVGALSDMYGRRNVAIVGQLCLMLGPVITSVAQTMNIAICGQVFSGVGAGLNELIALAATAEMVPIAKRGTYVGGMVFTIIPFCPSALWAQLIARASNWRFNGIFVGVWNLVGLLMVIAFYSDPPKPANHATKKEILQKIDYVGGLLSTAGVLLFMMGMQWGAVQYSWGSAQVLVPFILGILFLIGFFVWEVKFAHKFCQPMVPGKLFSLDKRTMAVILLITFVSGGNFFVLLLMFPSQVYHVWGPGAIEIGTRTLPMGFGIIGGSFLVLLILPHIRGRIKELMIVLCFFMTGFCGAMAVANRDNINTVLAIVLFASIGVGGVIIPASIIAQIICPPELIATITAITLSIRYVGGAVAFTTYYNAVFHQFTSNAVPVIAVQGIISNGIVAPENLETITALVTLVGQFRYSELRELIETSPDVLRRDIAFAVITRASQETYALAYQYPYYISIAFGGVCCILSFFLRDIRRFMTMQVTVGSAAGPQP